MSFFDSHKSASPFFLVVFWRTRRAELEVRGAIRQRDGRWGREDNVCTPCVEERAATQGSARERDKAQNGKAGAREPPRNREEKRNESAKKLGANRFVGQKEKEKENISWPNSRRKKTQEPGKECATTRKTRCRRAELAFSAFWVRNGRGVWIFWRLACGHLVGRVSVCVMGRPN